MSIVLDQVDRKKVTKEVVVEDEVIQKEVYINQIININHYFVIILLTAAIIMILFMVISLIAVIISTTVKQEASLAASKLVQFCSWITIILAITLFISLFFINQKTNKKYKTLYIIGGVILAICSFFLICSILTITVMLSFGLELLLNGVPVLFSIVSLFLSIAIILFSARLDNDDPREIPILDNVLQGVIIFISLITTTFLFILFFLSFSLTFQKWIIDENAIFHMLMIGNMILNSISLGLFLISCFILNKTKLGFYLQVGTGIISLLGLIGSIMVSVKYNLTKYMTVPIITYSITLVLVTLSLIFDIGNFKYRK